MGSQWKETPKNSFEEEHSKRGSAEGMHGAGSAVTWHPATGIIAEALSMLGYTQI